MVKEMPSLNSRGVSELAPCVGGLRTAESEEEMDKQPSKKRKVCTQILLV